MIDPISITMISVVLVMNTLQIASDILLHIKSLNSNCLGRNVLSVKASFKENNKNVNTLDNVKELVDIVQNK